ncbi:MAG: MFS transporter [Candidatus Eremiobacteraeota bacterium]|nr:MFS transporter [Candidatus Eremiobacteraeota bacterium]
MRFGLPRQVVPIYAVIFIDVVGYTFLIPLLPALGRRFDASATTMGALLSTAAICATVSSPLWGRLSDRIGRKRVLMASQGFTLCGYLLLALAGSVPVLFLSRAIQGLGGGNLGVAQAYVVDAVAEKDRERALALSTAAFGLGFVVGPIVSGLLVKISLDAPFWAGVGFEALNILLSGFFLRGIDPEPVRPLRGEMRRALRSPAMLNVLARQFLFIFAFTYLFGTFGLYLDRALRASATADGLMLAAAGAIGAVTLIFVVAPLERKLGTFQIVQVGFALAIVAYALIGFVRDVAAFAIVLVLWAVAGSALFPSLQKLIVDRAPPNRRGAMLGVADSLNNAAMIFAPAVAGAILELNVRLSGVLPAACMAAAFGLGFLRKKE